MLAFDDFPRTPVDGAFEAALEACRVGTKPGFFWRPSDLILASCEAVGCVNPPCTLAGRLTGSAGALDVAVALDEGAAVLLGLAGAEGALTRGLPSALVFGGSIALLAAAPVALFVAV